jgi:TIR domain
MKVFISWSGDRSRAMAEQLRDWLPTIVQSLDPFVSTQDVPVGGRGLNVLASQLQDCSFGILCLTQENKQGPWIHFEAGALSKVIEASRVVPLLLDLKVSDLTGPLVQFQAVSTEDRDGFFTLIKALAEHSSPPITESRLQRLFNAFWPELEAKISELKAAATSGPKQELRSERELLEEVLVLSRSAERLMSRAITAQTGNFTRSARNMRSLELRMVDIEDGWEVIVDAIKRDSRVGWMLLKGARPINLVEDILTIEFPRQGDIKAFFSSNYQELLQNALLDLAGARLRLAAVVRPGASPSTHPADETTSKELTGMDLIQKELGEQVIGEPPSGYSDEPPF